LRGYPIVVRRVVENGERSVAVDAESSKKTIAPIGHVEVVAGVGAPSAIGLRNKKITTGQAEEQQKTQTL
jgi:hypothetical protein